MDILDNTGARHFVTYHQENGNWQYGCQRGQLRGPYALVNGRFSYSSGRQRANLAHAVGAVLWVVSASSDRRYQLSAVYVPDDLREANGYCVLSGKRGHLCAVDLTDERWFRELQKSEANFSLGLSEVKQAAFQRCLRTSIAHQPQNDWMELHRQAQETLVVL